MDNRPVIVCTGFAQQDWVLNILGDQLESWQVIRINDKGTDMHSYEPSASDIVTMTECDLLIYNGGASEEWVEEIASGQDFQGEAYCLLTQGSAMTIEDESHSHDESNSHDQLDQLDELDEHIWLSPKEAKTFCSGISQAMASLDPDHSHIYEANSKAYIMSLEDLDQEYAKVVGDASNKEIVLADRHPFRYLVRDYGLTCYAAFDGCSAETEASFDTIIDLGKRLKQSNLKSILICENSNDLLAQAVIDNSGLSGVEILVLNSMQSIASGSSESAQSQSYIDIMKANLKALTKALG